MENNKNEEGTKDLDRYEKIVEFARKEIDHVHSVYKWLAWILGIFIVIATYLTWDSIRDMKNSIRSEVDIVQGQVNRRIDEEFKKEKIQSLIEDKAREYTERVAQQYIATEVNGVITPFKKEIQNTINDANAQIQKLNNLYHVFYLASHAKSGSKSAYLDLRQYVASARTEEAIIARDNLEEINRDLRQYRSVAHQPKLARMEIYRDANDGKTICIQDDSIDILTIRLTISPDNERHVLMEYIEKKPKEEIFKTALKVFESDSLPACAIFCGILSGISEEKAEFLDFDRWTEICKKQVDKQ